MTVASRKRETAIINEPGAAAVSSNGQLVATALKNSTVRVFACPVCQSIDELLHVAEKRIAEMNHK
jgi:hypothetical protein